jgi:hypothetical protein
MTIFDIFYFCAILMDLLLLLFFYDLSLALIFMSTLISILFLQFLLFLLLKIPTCETQNPLFFVSPFCSSFEFFASPSLSSASPLRPH